MALTQLPSNIRRGPNPRTSDCEPSTLPLDHTMGYNMKKCAFKQNFNFFQLIG